MVLFEYIGGTRVFMEIEDGLNAMVHEPLIMVLGGMALAAALYALTRRY